MRKTQQLLWSEQLAEERWRKVRERKISQSTLASKILEFYDCTYCAQSYAIMPSKCIKCNHCSFEIMSIRICFIKENE